MNIELEERFSGEPDAFWNGISIWHNNPHLLNKRIAGQNIVFSGKVCEKIAYELLLQEIQTYISKDENINLTKEKLSIFLKNIFLPFDTNNIFNPSNQDNYFTLRELIYKKNNIPSELELCYLDKKSTLITIINLQSKLTYTLKLNNGYIILTSFDLQSEIANWLKNKFFPKVIKWMLNKICQTDNIKSHGLLKQDRYVTLYQDLKEKYGKKMVEIWPENTDPYKFVYEDIAIACYLLSLWETYEPNKKQKFIDLGCGNGLLVFILTNEGHIGSGIDVRKRKIWDMYPKNIILKEYVITPSNSCLFPDVDWIIGNHSDELSPWIPIIAARSSFQTKYFLLPCCAFEFDGSKFQRKNSNLSQYRAFLEYLKNISLICGFETSIDRLKIPSTKRICLIGLKRNYQISDYKEINKNIENLLSDKSSDKTEQFNSNDLWVNNFKTREKEEKVKNCTKINVIIIYEIVNLVIRELLKKKNYIILDDGKKWNCGTKISLKEIAKLIPKTKLAELKKEFGGLKTLLKNNHQIFQVINGDITIKIPVISEKLYNPNWKTKDCWFYLNHPDGCPLENEKCKFNHKK